MSRKPMVGMNWNMDLTNVRNFSGKKERVEKIDEKEEKQMIPTAASKRYTNVKAQRNQPHVT